MLAKIGTLEFAWIARRDRVGFSKGLDLHVHHDAGDSTSKFQLLISSGSRDKTLSVFWLAQLVRCFSVCSSNLHYASTIGHTEQPVLHHTTPHYPTLRCTTPHYTTLHYTTLHYTTLHYTTLHYTTTTTTLHYATLHCTTLHYTTLHYGTTFLKQSVLYTGAGDGSNCPCTDLHDPRTHSCRWCCWCCTLTLDG